MKNLNLKSTFAAIWNPVQKFMDEPMPRGVGWFNTLGSALLALIIVQITTGILLALYYSPNASVAYESVQYIERHVVFGHIIRGIHHFAASAVIVVIFLHIMRTFFHAAYKHPRELTWVLGVLLFLLILAFAFTGYLLPWDMKAYFATKVGINIGATAPGLGQYIKKIMQGGDEMGTFTLSRFFALHVIVLPILLLVIVGGHIYLVRYNGPTAPGKKEGEPVAYSHKFFPNQLFRDSLVAFTLIMIVLGLAVKFGAPLENKADPTDTTYIPRPDWYFYGLFQLLKIFEGKLEFLGAVVLPTVFFGILLLLPFLDRNPERRFAQRRSAVGIGSLVVVTIIVLTTWGGYQGEKAKRLLAANLAALTADNDVDEPPRFDATVGKMLFEQLKCASCHAGSSRGDNLPPGLEFAGNKYRQDWLIAYLKSPYRVRWLRKDERPVARMPDFEISDKEAGDLAAYLMTQRDDRKFAPVDLDWAAPDSELIALGKEDFGSYGCDGCHAVAGKGSHIGPELANVGSKLQETYIYHLVQTPKSIIPETPMKDYKLDADIVEEIVAYLREQK